MSAGYRVLASATLLAVMCGTADEPLAARVQDESFAGRIRTFHVARGVGTHPAAHPQDTDARAREAYRQARERQAAGDDDGALALLWQASGLAPRDADIQMALAGALERVGALDAAIEAWRAALVARPGERKASRGLVLALVAVGRSPEAVVLARAAAEAAPSDPDALCTLGLAQSELDVDAALATFRSALARAPDHTLSRYNLALLLKRLDRLDEAIAELMRVIAREPRPEAQYALGVAWWHRGDAARATAAFEATIALEPKHAEAYHKLGVVRAAEREWDGAAAALRRSLELRPDVPEVHLSLARVLSASGDEAAARAHLARAERLRHESEREHEARVWTSLGSARLEGGDPIAALDAFRRALAIRDTYAPAHFQMGRALERLGDAEAADGAYARARQLNPHLVRGTRIAPERVP